ncbi:MAG: lipoyl(octanoyl) transferase LipB [Thermodesulfobacteriota bacterium]
MDGISVGENNRTQGRPGPWLAVDMGRVPYGPVLAFQTALVEARKRRLIEQDVVLILEHEPVFTLGRRGVTENLLVTPEFLGRAGVPVVHVERGGDVTYHGPGQLVVYPIVDLPGARLKVVEFVEKLEEVMILTASDLGVEAVRDPRNRGVWVGDRKLGSVGIAVRRGTSFHGLALNVNPDLTPFEWINPCGLKGVHMTSLAGEGARDASPDRVRPMLKRRMEEVFGVSLEDTPLSVLEDVLADELFSCRVNPRMKILLGKSKSKSGSLSKSKYHGTGKRKT